MHTHPGSPGHPRTKLPYSMSTMDSVVTAGPQSRVEGYQHARIASAHPPAPGYPHSPNRGHEDLPSLALHSHDQSRHPARALLPPGAKPSLLNVACRDTQTTPPKPPASRVVPAPGRAAVEEAAAVLGDAGCVEGLSAVTVQAVLGNWGFRCVAEVWTLGRAAVEPGWHASRPATRQDPRQHLPVLPASKRPLQRREAVYPLPRRQQPPRRHPRLEVGVFCSCMSGSLYRHPVGRGALSPEEEAVFFGDDFRDTTMLDGLRMGTLYDMTQHTARED